MVKESEKGEKVCVKEQYCTCVCVSDSGEDNPACGEPGQSPGPEGSTPATKIHTACVNCC